MPAIEQTVSAVQTDIVRIHCGKAALQAVGVRTRVNAMRPRVRNLSLNIV